MLECVHSKFVSDRVKGKTNGDTKCRRYVVGEQRPHSTSTVNRPELDDPVLSDQSNVTAVSRLCCSGGKTDDMVGPIDFLKVFFAKRGGLFNKRPVSDSR